MKNNIIKKSISSITSHFLAGLLVIVPSVLSIVIVYYLFIKIDSILGKYLIIYFGPHYKKGIGFLILLLIIWFTGLLTRTYFIRKIIYWYEEILTKIPLINIIFKALKEISVNIFTTKNKSFKYVTLVQLSKDTFIMGFLTSMKTVQIQHKNRVIKAMNIFIPTTPNPTSGFVIIVPVNKIIITDVQPDIALKAIFSLGVIHPEKYNLLNNKFIKNY